MPRSRILRTVPVVRTPRVLQLEGLFEVPPTLRSESVWDVTMPIEEKPWNIGLIVGPSGSGKSTVGLEVFGESQTYVWPDDKSIVDAFPQSMGIRDVTALLSSVGFSSPPSWLRPYRFLSTGEQFRVNVARSLAEADKGATVFIDEFTSVVDRTVAQIGSAAVAKAIRRADRRFVAASCHYDIIDWLQPDWLYEPATDSFTWRSLQRRPSITLAIRRVHHSAWQLFRKHHYLDTNLNTSAQNYVAYIEETPVAFCAMLAFPHPKRPGWRAHRTVCLPDYQGVGIGNALNEYVCSLYAATGRNVMDVTGNPAMIQHRARSPLWDLVRKPSHSSSGDQRGLKGTSLAASGGARRLTATFRYVGPARVEDARGFGVSLNHKTTTSVLKTD